MEKCQKCSRPFGRVIVKRSLCQRCTHLSAKNRATTSNISDISIHYSKILQESRIEKDVTPHDAILDWLNDR